MHKTMASKRLALLLLSTEKALIFFSTSRLKGNFKKYCNPENISDFDYWFENSRLVLEVYYIYQKCYQSSLTKNVSNMLKSPLFVAFVSFHHMKLMVATSFG